MFASDIRQLFLYVNGTLLLLDISYSHWRGRGKVIGSIVFTNRQHLFDLLYEKKYLKTPGLFIVLVNVLSENMTRLNAAVLGFPQKTLFS